MTRRGSNYDSLKAVRVINSRANIVYRPERRVENEPGVTMSHLGSKYDLSQLN
jgi:hypothetical protein